MEALRRMPIQTADYTRVDGVLNATSSFPSAPQSSVHTPDIRANVLWFASLICSLGAASFAILIQQSLRGYLEPSYTSQERVRIRGFLSNDNDNEHELRKLSNIAAILPLFLLLSLVLFFLGLYFFAHGAHATIGTISASLVGGWGFLFITALISPTFSLCLPYKMTFTEGFCGTARPATCFIVAAAKIAGTFVTNGATLASQHIPQLIYHTVPGKHLKRVFTWVTMGLAQPENEHISAIETTHCSTLRLPDEDDCLCKADNANLQNPRYLDAISTVTHSRLLHAIREALEQQKYPEPQITEYLSGSVHRRLGKSGAVSQFAAGGPLDLRSVPENAWVSLMDILGGAMSRELDVAGPDAFEKEWFNQAFRLLLTALPPVKLDSVTSLICSALEQLFWADRKCTIFLPDGESGRTEDGWDVVSTAIYNITDAAEAMATVSPWIAWSITIGILNPSSLVQGDVSGPGLRASARSLDLFVELVISLLCPKGGQAGEPKLTWVYDAFEFLLQVISVIQTLPAESSSYQDIIEKRRFVIRNLVKLAIIEDHTCDYFEALSSHSEVLVTKYGLEIFDLRGISLPGETSSFLVILHFENTFTFRQRCCESAESLRDILHK